MFANTKPHSNTLENHQYSIRTGGSIPNDAISLSYYNARRLIPQENVDIVDTSRFIPENTNQEYTNELTLYCDDNRLVDENFKYPTFNSNLFEVTNKFSNDNALYYRYKANYKVYLSDSNSSVLLVDSSGNKLNSHYKYKIEYVKTDIDGEYDLYIYTSFIIKNNFKVFCIYNAINKSKDELEIMANYKEPIIPKPFNFINQDFIVKGNVITVKGKTLLKSNLVDTLDCVLAIGANETYELINIDKAFYDKSIVDLYNDNNMLLNGETVLDSTSIKSNKYIVRIMYLKKGNEIIWSFKEWLDDYNITGTEEELIQTYLYKTDTFSCPYIKLSYGYDGSTPISYKILDSSIFEYKEEIRNIPDKYILSATKVHECFSVLLKDNQRIHVSLPLEDKPFENWIPRIKAGMFLKEYPIGIVKYKIDEYYTKNVYGKYGFPYVDIVNESCKIINVNTIKTKYYPLHVILDDNNKPTNINITVNGNKANIKYCSIGDGLIELYDDISSNDIIMINYSYEESYINYTGYYDNELQSFMNIDLNPNQYHMIRKVTDGKLDFISTHTLFEHPLYIYLAPYDINGEINKTNIYHSFDGIPKGEYDILLCKIYLRHNSSIDSLKLIDTRVRGGGIDNKIQEHIREFIEPESNDYADIGYYDGYPYNENAVVIVRLDRNILKDYGGYTTKEDVEVAVRKWMALGTVPIIEYVKTYSKENSPNNGLVVNRTRSNVLDFKANISLSIQDSLIAPKVIKGYKFKKIKPYGIIKILNEGSEIINATMVNEVEGSSILNSSTSFTTMDNSYNIITGTSTIPNHSNVIIEDVLTNTSQAFIRTVEV